MTNPFINFTKKDWILWAVSLASVVASNLYGGNIDVITFAATVIGVTALIFAAKGHVLSPILLVVFCILYSIISLRFHYWGELITFAGMSLPMEVLAAVSWLKNPSEKEGEVKIAAVSARNKVIVAVLAVVVTVAFYFILRAFDTPNLAVSTLSVTTSFIAASMTMLRSSYYAFWYGFNDIVLVVLWAMASAVNPIYIPVAVNFAIFLVNDIYGFFCWKKREKEANI